MARATVGLASLERDEGHFLLSRQHFVQAMNLAIWAGQYNQLTDILHGMAVLEMLMGELEVATEVLHEVPFLLFSLFVPFSLCTRRPFVVLLWQNRLCGNMFLL